MTVKELRDKLLDMPDDAPLAIQGTSIPVYPHTVKRLTDLVPEDDNLPDNLYPFDLEPTETVVILTQ